MSVYGRSSTVFQFISIYRIVVAEAYKYTHDRHPRYNSYIISVYNICASSVAVFIFVCLFNQFNWFFFFSFLVSVLYFVHCFRWRANKNNFIQAVNKSVHFISKLNEDRLPNDRPAACFLLRIYRSQIVPQQRVCTFNTI